jgi:hypothetical protein
MELYFSGASTTTLSFPKIISGRTDDAVLCVPKIKTTTWSTHSRRIDPINLSAKPFCQGAPDQPEKIAHRERVSADSRSRSAVLGLR